MWGSALLCLFAGVLVVNATPHFVKGLTQEPFPTPFGGSPVITVIAGWAMYGAAGAVLVAAQPSRHAFAAVAGGSLGALAMSLFHARIGAFGRR
jgi:hypothetical protein